MPSQGPLRSFPHLFQQAYPDPNAAAAKQFLPGRSIPLISPKKSSTNNTQATIVTKARFTLPVLLNDAALCEWRRHGSRTYGGYNTAAFTEPTKIAAPPQFNTIPTFQSASEYRPIFLSRKSKEKNSHRVVPTYLGGVLYPSPVDVAKARNNYSQKVASTHTKDKQANPSSVLTQPDAQKWAEFEAYKHMLNERMTVVSESSCYENSRMKREVADLSQRMAVLERDLAALVRSLSGDSRIEKDSQMPILFEQSNILSFSECKAVVETGGSGQPSTVASPRVGAIQRSTMDNVGFKVKGGEPLLVGLEKQKLRTSPRGRPTDTYRKELLTVETQKHYLVAKGASAELDALWKTMKV